MLGPSEIATHKHVIGLSGMGKSRLLASMFAQLASQGQACALIDPHADLAQDTLALLVENGFFNQIGGYQRLVYIDFSNRERFLPFNFLRQRYSTHDVARHVVEACKRAWPALSSGAAPQFENILLAGTFALIENGRPLTELPRLLTDQYFRDSLLAGVSDPEVVGFFRNRFDRWGKDAPMMIESTLRRVFLLTFSPTLRFSLGQSENALDFRRLMDDGVCAIFNLGSLDEETQRFIGCLLTVGFEVAALSRADTPLAQRRKYHLIIDEFSQFSATSEEALARVLSLARKYGLYLVLAHQTWSQLSSRLHGALQNAVEVAFRLGRSDAEWAAPRFGQFEPLAVKHEVLDPSQVERTHPLFYSVQETFESWTRALMDLEPRQAYVKLGARTVKMKTLTASPSERALAQVSRIVEHYTSDLLRPQTAIWSRDVTETRTTARFVVKNED
ncbi:MAG: type IV secretory system conjugative DNA transfer family protein [Candidatus Obscuribacterales bacterium]